MRSVPGSAPGGAGRWGGVPIDGEPELRGADGQSKKLYLPGKSGHSGRVGPQARDTRPAGGDVNAEGQGAQVRGQHFPQPYYSGSVRTFTQQPAGARQTRP